MLKMSIFEKHTKPGKNTSDVSNSPKSKTESAQTPLRVPTFERAHFITLPYVFHDVQLRFF